jgi:hypothetical protein
MPTVTKQSPRAPILTSKSSGGVLDRIKPIGFDKDDGLRMLIYGKSGTGKTTLWSSFPGPILCVVCSGGSQPGELRSIDTPDMRKKVSQVTLTNTEELRQLCRHVEEKSSYETVVLDHATGFQDFKLKELLGLDEIPVGKSWGMASQQQYGQATTQCKEDFRALLNLPCNVVIVAQERTFGGSDDAANELLQPSVGAALMPSLTGWLNPACDYVVQTYLRPKMEEVKTKIGQGPTAKVMTTTKRGKGIEYCLRTEPHDIYMTKFRMPKGRQLPECIVDPTYAKILELIRG